MPYDPEIHHRRSTRLKGFDYSSANAYFVTICTYEREPSLAIVEDGEVFLTAAGEAVEATWGRLPTRFPGLALDSFIVMPTHVHGIVILGYDPGAAAEAFRESGKLPSLGQALRAFKSVSAIAANRALDRGGAPFWHRGFHDRIIRDDRELGDVRTYILDNPANWATDEHHPDAPALLPP